MLSDFGTYDLNQFNNLASAGNSRRKLKKTRNGLSKTRTFNTQSQEMNLAYSYNQSRDKRAKHNGSQEFRPMTSQPSSKPKFVKKGGSRYSQ